MDYFVMLHDSLDGGSGNLKSLLLQEATGRSSNNVHEYMMRTHVLCILVAYITGVVRLLKLTRYSTRVVAYKIICTAVFAVRQY